MALRKIAVKRTVVAIPVRALQTYPITHMQNQALAGEDREKRVGRPSRKRDVAASLFHPPLDTADNALRPQAYLSASIFPTRASSGSSGRGL